MALPKQHADRSDRGTESGEGVGYCAGGSHHGSRTIGVSFLQHLLKMQANVDVKYRVMQVPHGKLYLRI